MNSKLKEVFGVISYFIIVFILFSIAKYFGLLKDFSVIAFSIGSTIGFIIVKAFEYMFKYSKLKKKGND